MTKRKTADEVVDLTPEDDRPAPAAEVPPLADPEGPPADLGPVPVDVPEQVTEEQVRRVLATAGRLLHHVAGHPDIPEHWSFTDDELDQLTPPVTGYVNRSARLRAAVARGDGLTLTLAVGAWVQRNVRLSQDIAAVEAEQADAGQPAEVAGQPAQPWEDLPR